MLLLHMLTIGGKRSLSELQSGSMLLWYKKKKKRSLLKKMSSTLLPVWQYLISVALLAKNTQILILWLNLLCAYFDKWVCLCAKYLPVWECYLYCLHFLHLDRHSNDENFILVKSNSINSIVSHPAFLFRFHLDSIYSTYLEIQDGKWVFITDWEEVFCRVYLKSYISIYTIL